MLRQRLTVYLKCLFWHRTCMSAFSNHVSKTLAKNQNPYPFKVHTGGGGLSYSIFSCQGQQPGIYIRQPRHVCFGDHARGSIYNPNPRAWPLFHRHAQESLCVPLYGYKTDDVRVCPAFFVSFITSSLTLNDWCTDIV